MAIRYQDKAGYWYVKYKDLDGKWKSKYCGKNATASDAEIIRKNFDSIELNHRHKLPIRIVEADLKENLKLYRDNEIPKSKTGRPKSRKGIERYKAIVNNFILFLVEKKLEKYTQVTHDIANEFIQQLIAPPLSRSASTVSKHRQTMAAFWSWSIDRNHCTANPWNKIPNPKREKKVPRFYSETELSEILADAKEPYKNVFEFLYHTGLRIGELSNLEWRDYVKDQKYIVLRVMEGNKTKREEIVPLNEYAIKILNDQWKKRESPESLIYIFVNQIGVKLDNANIYRHLKVVQGHCNITGASPHTFRHTFASHLAIKGVSLKVIQELLRHASIEETMIYAHLSKDSARNAISLLSTPKPLTK